MSEQTGTKVETRNGWHWLIEFHCLADNWWHAAVITRQI